MKNFNLSSTDSRYLIIYNLYHCYLYYYQTSDHYEYEDKKAVIYAIIKTIFIPAIIYETKNLFYPMEIDFNELLDTENSIIFNVLKKYMSEKDITTFDNLAMSLDGSYQANLKQISRIRLQRNIPKNGKFYKLFEPKYKKLLESSTVIENLIQQSNLYFSKDITKEFITYFLDFHNSKDLSNHPNMKSFLLLYTNGKIDSLVEIIDKTVNKFSKNKTNKTDNNLILQFEYYQKAKESIVEKNFVEASNYYKKSIELFQYKNKKYLIDILDEYLTLLAYLNKKVIFKNYFYKLSSLTTTIYGYEDYFQLKIFESINKFGLGDSFNSLLTPTKDIVIDFNNVNKIIKASKYYRDLTQLMYLISSLDFSKDKFSNIKRLIESGADVNKKAKDNSTPLLRAIQTVESDARNIMIVDLLLEQPDIYKSINCKTKLNKTTVLNYVVNQNDIELLNKIVKIKDIDLNEKLNDTNIFYHLISKFDLVNNLSSKEKNIGFEQIKIFIKNGVEINFKLIRGMFQGERWEYTPLMYSCEIGEKRVIELLVNSGAKDNFNLSSKMKAQDILKIYHPDLLKWYLELLSSIV